MNRKGFTLIELLVVISIITILAAISIPQFAKYRVRAYNATAISDLRNIKTTLEAEYANDLAYPDGSLDGSTGGTDVSDVIGAFIPSGHVTVYYDPAVKGDDPQMYVIGTKHRDGNRVYAASSHTSLLYYQENPTDEDAWVGVSLSAVGCTFPAPAQGTPPSDGQFSVWTAQ